METTEPVVLLLVAIAVTLKQNGRPVTFFPQTSILFEERYSAAKGKLTPSLRRRKSGVIS